MAASVRCEVDAAGIARITLDEPNSRANTLHRAVWEQLGEACRALHRRNDVRGLIVQSAKPGIFIAGADLREIADLPIEDPEPTRALVRRGRDVLAALEALPFPTVAAIDGAALGGGFEVALACDSRIAGSNPKIKIGLPEVKLGLIPGWGGTQRPTRIVGLSKAVHLVCSGASQSADSAHSLGLIDSISESDVMDESAVSQLVLMRQKETWRQIRSTKADWVAEIGHVPTIETLVDQLPAESHTACREAFRVTVEGARVTLEESLQIEESAFVPLVASDNARKLIGSFLKR